ncbi:MAG: hypothetical protein ACRDN1_04855 [Trebonia sp.]
MLSLAASFCTATSPVCQRLGARHLEANGHQVLGFTAMIAGFVLQVAASRGGSATRRAAFLGIATGVSWSSSPRSSRS